MPIGIYGSNSTVTKAYPDSSGATILLLDKVRMRPGTFMIRAYEGPIGITGSTSTVTKAYPDSSGAIILTVFGHL